MLNLWKIVYRQREGRADGRTDGRTDRQTDRDTDRDTDRQTDRHAQMQFRLSFRTVIFITDMTKGRGLSVKQGTQLLTVLSTFSMVGNGAVAFLYVIKKMAMLRLYAATTLGCALATFSFALLDYLDGGKN